MTRSRLILAVVAATFLAIIAWYMQPERRLVRSWNKLIEVVEARHARALGTLLADSYSDRWGYSKSTLVQDARLAFHHFDAIEIRVDEQRLELAGDHATISAILRVDVRGTSRAAEARVATNSLFSPFVFEWRRSDSFPWSWELVRFDQPEFDLDRFRRGMSAGY